jgi:excisionase family DNA binding protein
MEIETNSSNGNVARKQLPSAAVKLLTPKEAAQLLKVSLSWLAKARMRGDGPPFIKIGRAVRYSEAALLQWMRAQQRPSTSE